MALVHNRMKSIHSRRNAEFCALIVSARRKAYLSQEELGRRLHITQSSVSKVERGERRLDVVEYLNWCEAIGVEPEKIIRQIRKG